MISLSLPDSISNVDISHQTWQSVAVAVVVIDVFVVDVVIALHHHAAAIVIVGK